MHKAERGLQNSSEQADLWWQDYLAMAIWKCCICVMQFFKAIPVKLESLLLPAGGHTGWRPLVKHKWYHTLHTRGFPMLHLLSSTNTSYREGISFALKIYSLIYHAGRLVTLTPLCYSSTIKHIHAIQTDPCFCISCSLESSRSHTFIFAKLAVARKQKKNAGNGSVELGNMQAVFLQHRKTDRNSQVTSQAWDIQGCLLTRKAK